MELKRRKGEWKAIVASEGGGRLGVDIESVRNLIRKPKRNNKKKKEEKVKKNGENLHGIDLRVVEDR